jgi:hypothetical protein
MATYESSKKQNQFFSNSLLIILKQDNNLLCICISDIRRRSTELSISIYVVHGKAKFGLYYFHKADRLVRSKLIRTLPIYKGKRLTTGRDATLLCNICNRIYR